MLGSVHDAEDQVAVESQVSVFAGLIAANLPGGSEVLTATGDFTSILFPFYAQSGRGIRVREVPLDRIAECVTSRTTLVAVSAVQSAGGRVADLDALHAASGATGAVEHAHAWRAIPRRSGGKGARHRRWPSGRVPQHGDGVAEGDDADRQHGQSPVGGAPHW